ncbi:MAG: ATP-binding cassette domain-containing protein [Anaerolineae bacterium]|nr:ATP-binding cassette domain-containing protein [Anaerolineae bacterium]
MLEGKGLGFRYGPRRPWVLRDVSISVAPGEVVGLRGPSGQGKTTLAKILAGYLRPVEGQVWVDGQALPQRGYCPVQLIFQHPELAINPRWRMARVLNEGYTPPPDLLEALNIEPGWLTRWPHELSGGELQRFAVARALGPQTRYLIADEMTTMLDANTQAQIWQVVLAHARQRRIGVLAISHDQTLLARISDRILTLDGGTIVHCCFTPHESREV